MSKIDVFSKFQPVSLDLIKNEDDTITIEGIATTEHEDSHGEIILQDGLDFSYCLKSGAFNYDHKNDPKYIIGAPQKVKRVMHNGKPATSIKGVLYSQKQIVKDIVENYKAMKSAGGLRQLGFSIEGQVLSRDNKNPHIITRAKVLNVSLTHNPANTEATIALVKNILNNIEKEEVMSEDLNKNEYNDLHMSLGEARLSYEYSEKLVMLLESFGEEADLPEWCQKAISMAKENLQKAFHYLEQEHKEEMIETEKDVNPEYLESLEEESVVAPEEVKVDYIEKSDCKSDEELDKMSPKEMIDYIRFLEGLKKETDLSPIQPESLEDTDEMASEDMNIGEPDDEEEDEGIELEIEGLTPQQLKELVMGLLKLGLPVDKMSEYIELYYKK